MSRRRQLLRGDQGPKAGYRYWRFSKTDIDGNLNVQPFSQVSDFKLYEQYNQSGNSLPSPLLTSIDSNPNFTVTCSPTTLQDPARQLYMAFDNSNSYWQPSNYTAWYITIDFNRNRLIKSFFMSKYDFSLGQHIKVEVSDTGLFNGEEILLDITNPNNQRSYNTFYWNLLGEEFPTRIKSMTKDSSTINSLTLSCGASTSLNSTIANYDWYVDGVYNSTTTSTSVTITGLSPATTYKITAVAEDANGLRGNTSQDFEFTTDSVGVLYTQGTGSGSYTHYRFQAVDSSGSITNTRAFIIDCSLFTSTNGAGTEYPTTNLTSTTSEAGITISSGYYYGSYTDWKAFDNPAFTGNGWWTLSCPDAALNWLQIEFNTAKTIESVYFAFNTTHHLANGLKLYGSNTGAFTGEEDLIGELQNIREGSITVSTHSQNL